MSKMIPEFLSEYLKTQEGKMLKDKIDTFKGHCIEEKLAFANMIENNPELLKERDNKLRYECYLDDIINFKYCQMLECKHLGLIEIPKDMSFNDMNIFESLHLLTKHM